MATVGILSIRQDLDGHNCKQCFSVKLFLNIFLFVLKITFFTNKKQNKMIKKIGFSVF